MKGLIYKDLIVLWKQGKMYLLIILIFSLIPQLTRAGFAMAYAAILPYTIIAYDEQSKWNRLAIMMPYTDAQLVLSKYLLSWAAILLVMVPSAASRTVDYLVKGQAALLVAEYQEVVILTAVSALFTAIILPLVFRFGVERGRLAVIPLVVVGVTGAVFVVKLFMPLPIWATVFISILLAVAANAVSVHISRKLFRRGLRA